MKTAHMADDAHPTRTLCGEPWEDWQDPDQGASLEETLAVPGLTQVEKAEIRSAERRKSEGPVRQCQACFKRMREMGHG